MKNSQKNIELRQKQIIKLLQNHKQLSPNEIAELLATSISTIRRDLTVLADKNQIIKEHGYCSYNFNNDQDFDVTGPEYLKTNIAKEAAHLVHNNQTLFINTSSTALEVIQYIKAKNISVISNNVRLINKPQYNGATFFLLGGEIRFPKEALVGDMAIKALTDIKADICFIGCSGIDIENGVTTKIIHEARVNEMMIKNTLYTKVLVADYRKIGKTSKFKIADLEDFDYLFTDSYCSPTILKKIEKLGVKVVQVKQINY